MTTNENTAATGNVLTNDTDVDAGDTKTVSAVNGSAGNVGASVAGTYGSVVIGSNGAYTFTPNAAANALAAGQTVTDTFTYTMRDAAGATSSTSLTVTITGANDGPVAVADAGSVQEDVTTSATGNVLTNDTDVDTGDTKTVSAVGGAAGNVGVSVAGTYGSVVIGASGAYTYTLNNASAGVQALGAGQTATDTFTYTMRDASGATSSSTLTITVTGTNDAPVAVADAVTTNENTAATGNVLTNDTDVDTGDTKTVSAVNGVRRQCRRLGRRHLRLGGHRVERRLHLHAECRRERPRRRPDGHRHLHLHHARCIGRHQLGLVHRHGHRRQ